MTITEDKIENFAIESNSIYWLGIYSRFSYSPEGEKPERENYEQIILLNVYVKQFQLSILTFHKKHKNRQYKKYFASIPRIFFTTTKHFISY